MCTVTPFSRTPVVLSRTACSRAASLHTQHFGPLAYSRGSGGLLVEAKTGGEGPRSLRPHTHTHTR